ncbi:unnamed protein product, partial [Nesidiocoris tenuis]
MSSVIKNLMKHFAPVIPPPVTADFLNLCLEKIIQNVSEILHFTPNLSSCMVGAGNKCVKLIVSVLGNDLQNVLGLMEFLYEQERLFDHQTMLKNEIYFSLIAKPNRRRSRCCSALYQTGSSAVARIRKRQSAYGDSLRPRRNSTGHHFQFGGFERIRTRLHDGKRRLADAEFGSGARPIEHICRSDGAEEELLRIGHNLPPHPEYGTGKLSNLRSDALSSRMDDDNKILLVSWTHEILLRCQEKGESFEKSPELFNLMFTFFCASADYRPKIALACIPVLKLIAFNQPHLLVASQFDDETSFFSCTRMSHCSIVQLVSNNYEDMVLYHGAIDSHVFREFMNYILDGTCFG